MPSLSLLSTLMFLQAAPVVAAPAPSPPYALPGEDAVAPYAARDTNAGTVPFKGKAMADAFRGQAGIHRIVSTLVAQVYADKVIGDIFKGHDKARLERTLFEQFCYILNGGCSYSGRDMAASHKDLGVQQGDMNRLVELLQKAMASEGVPFAAQNRFLSKLAPMRKDVVER